MVVQKIIRWIRREFELGNPLIHHGEVEAQSRFGSPEAALRLAQSFVHSSIPFDYSDFISSQDFFFLATADDMGRCDCSFRAVDPAMKQLGYPAVCVPDPATICFPDQKGNGLFQSFGNLLVNPHIGMLFINFETAQRVRVNGIAEIVEDRALAQTHFGESAHRLVRVKVQEVFANCPKNIPKLAPVDPI